MTNIKEGHGGCKPERGGEVVVERRSQIIRAKRMNIESPVKMSQPPVTGPRDCPCVPDDAKDGPPARTLAASREALEGQPLQLALSVHV
jgi:hypothetical protein